MTILNLTTDAGGRNTFGIVPSTEKKKILLVQNTAAAFTVPGTYPNYELIFSIDPGMRVWVSYDGTAAEYPSTGTWTNTNSELLPAVRTLKAGTVVSCITPDVTAQVGVMLYGIK